MMYGFSSLGATLIWDFIGGKYKSFARDNTLWISGLDLEVLWLAEVFPNQPNIIVPPLAALQRTLKPGIEAHEGLPFLIPPFLSVAASDWELHAFCRKFGWQVWLKGPYYEARRVTSWAQFEIAYQEL